MSDLYLIHHGIQGQKWGVRRFQNPDGSLTAAGRARYGENLDINDKSRRNIAKIRLGEARRRYDVAKRNNDTNKTRLAELKTRERSAKKMVKRMKDIDRGADKVSKGQTVTGNNVRVASAVMGSKYAKMAVKGLLHVQLNRLGAKGMYTAKAEAAAIAVNKMANTTINALTYGYAVKKEMDNYQIRQYNHARLTGDLTAKRVGSTEYRDVVERRKNH